MYIRKITSLIVTAIEIDEIYLFWALFFKLN